MKGKRIGPLAAIVVAALATAVLDDAVVRAQTGAAPQAPSGAQGQGPAPSGAQGQGAAPAAPQAEPGAKPADADLSAPLFLARLRAANGFEIEAGKLGIERATNGKLRQVAEMLVTDHTRAGEKLEALVKGRLAAEPKEAADDRATYDNTLRNLRAFNAAGFDHAFVTAQIDAHTKAIALVRAYADKGDDDELKAFARDLLPTLEQHMKAVQEIPLPT